MIDQHKLIAYGRFGFAAACVLAPKTAAVSIGAQPSEINPTAGAFAALVGTRAAALGVLGLSTPKLTAALRRRVFVLLATVDGIDTVVGFVRARQAGRTAPIVAGTPLGLLGTASEIHAALTSR
jgi:hypothetical protein